MPKIHPFIMSGGSGTRLWPLSRGKTPKQHLALTGDASLLHQTLERVSATSHTGLDLGPPTIICSRHHEENVAGVLAGQETAACRVVVEPIGRNTAPVAALAALETLREDPDGLVLLLPADHFIADRDGFWTAIQQGTDAAVDGHLVTLGIQPTGPETGYGYIKQREAIGDNLYKVDSFVEKPDLETALGYLSQGGYFWNAGIFLFHGKAMIAEFEKHAPSILDAVRRTIDASQRDGGTLSLDEETFSACPSDSIDYAIMEATEKAAMVAPVDIGWSDIGTWKSLMEISAGVENLAESDNVLMIDSKDTFVKSDNTFVATIGVSDLIVVTTGDAVLVTHKDRSQDLRRVIDHLKKAGRGDLL